MKYAAVRLWTFLGVAKTTIDLHQFMDIYNSALLGIAHIEPFEPGGFPVDS